VFTTVARRSCVAQPAAAPPEADADGVVAVCGDSDDDAGVEAAADEAEEAGAEEAGAEEAEEAVPAAGTEDDEPDEHPAAAATTAPAATAPPSLTINEAKLDITNHPLLAAHSRDTSRDASRAAPNTR
jgi:hypothetical protein